MERKSVWVRVVVACLAVLGAGTAHAQSGRVTLHFWQANGDASDLLGDAPGTPRNGVTYVDGHSQQAFSFNEAGVTGAAVDLGAAPLDVGGDNFALSFSMRTAQTGVVSEVLSKRPICNHGSFFDIRILGDGRLAVEFDDGAGNYFFVISTVPVTDGAWHHVVVVRKGTSNALFLDGRPEAEVTSPLGYAVNLQNGAGLTLGWGPCVWVDGTRPFVGAIDDVRLMSGFGP